MNNLEEQFNYFLQRNVVFSLDSKIIKDGKLVLFSQKDFYLNFFLKNPNGEQKKFELPYPFKIVREKNYLLLKYDMASISKGDHELYYRLLCLNKKPISRYYNNDVMIFEKNSLDLTPVSL
jgi:hypothetical protein